MSTRIINTDAYIFKLCIFLNIVVLCLCLSISYFSSCNNIVQKFYIVAAMAELSHL